MHASKDCSIRVICKHSQLLMTALLEYIDLFIKIVKKWSGHGLTSLSGSYGPAVHDERVSYLIVAL